MSYSSEILKSSSVLSTLPPTPTLSTDPYALQIEKPEKWVILVCMILLSIGILVYVIKLKYQPNKKNDNTKSSQPVPIY